MAHLRRLNSRCAPADAETGICPSDMLHVPPLRLTCRTCSLLCFGTLMVIFGALAGSSFKAAIIKAYCSAASHPGDWPAPYLISMEPEKEPQAAFTLDDVQEEEAAAPAVEEAPPSLHVCSDACPSSLNGVCDDGRDGNGRVLCDLGTDCSDCGGWSFEGIGPDETAPRPIKMLLDLEVTVNLAHTSTVPSFLMPYTDPAHDVDVSGQMAAVQNVEVGLTQEYGHPRWARHASALQMWHKALDGKCKGSDGGPELVLDIGANFGYYSFYAASHGCRVIAWEPVPIFRAFLQYGVLVNNMSNLIAIRETVVAEAPGQRLELGVPLRGNWGTASVDGRNTRQHKPDKHNLLVTALSERVDDVIREDALVIKLDVEGFEPSALRSLHGVFENHRVASFFMEYSPGVYEARSKWDEMLDMPKMLLYLLDRGFTILHVNDSLARGHNILKEPDWSDDLPPLEEVTAQNIRFDLEDAVLLKNRTLGCPAPSELAQFPGWANCNDLPSDLHPKSFRGSFGYNTNIWAVADRETVKVGPTVGIQSLKQLSQEWFGRNPEIGMGGVQCSTLPVTQKIRFRCQCEEAACNDEAAWVQLLSNQGKLHRLPNSNTLPD